jgi:nucleoside-diphosphate-sugar epimerase
VVIGRQISSFPSVVVTPGYLLPISGPTPRKDSATTAGLHENRAAGSAGRGGGSDRVQARRHLVRAVRQDAAMTVGRSDGGRRVAVTGAAGKLGRAVVRYLTASGWQVLSLDRHRPDPRVGSAGEFVAVDLGDHGQVREVLGGGVDEHRAPLDAVVHLAAVPAPGLVPDSATFANNATVTWNVFTAARAAGIRNVVWASSETVLGLPFDVPPPYVPVDEEYRPRPESTYSLVKVLEEEMAHHFCRWDPELKMIGLRFSNVMEPQDYEAFPGYDADPEARRWNLWGYIDARDGAQAVHRALEHAATGMDVFIIANADTVMSRSSADLVAQVYPGVEVRGELGRHQTLLSIDKARRVLGYEPEFSWRDPASRRL